MRLSLALSALVATITASPISHPNHILQPRQSVCTPPSSTTTTIGGASVTLTGPFKLQASSTSTSNPTLNGKYAHAGAPNTLPFVVFGAKLASKATEFYLDSSSNLVSIQADSSGNPALYYAYENPVSAVTGHVAIKDDSKVTNKVTCSIDGTSCALSCKVLNFSYNCLASPKYQPDWRIAGPAEANKAGCVAFTPIVIAG